MYENLLEHNTDVKFLCTKAVKSAEKIEQKKIFTLSFVCCCCYFFQIKSIIIVSINQITEKKQNYIITQSSKN